MSEDVFWQRVNALTFAIICVGIIVAATWWIWKMPPW